MQVKEIVFATNNNFKLEEVQAIIDQTCKECKIKILSLEDINFKIDIPETKDTLEGNAIQKARFIKNHTGYDCFADDTGLQVDALNGQPGVYSARYAGPKANFSDNIRKLLKKMDGKKNRKANFKTVIALVMGSNDFLFEGEVEGNILEKPQGKGGFGYDPVFRPKKHRKSFAEMDNKKKNSISHRYHATQKLASWFNENMNKLQ